ncbi:toxin-antitoxin system, antitoxin component, Xre domain protein [Actinobaculum sp. oral taxon 183 str. F0552]|nr:toxin-antitoxin system, antitoxin component, Xre domain protein [Actinobaculum sp. oral taxon 183 str. F0552]
MAIRANRHPIAMPADACASGQPAASTNLPQRQTGPAATESSGAGGRRAQPAQAHPPGTEDCRGHSRSPPRRSARHVMEGGTRILPRRCRAAAFCHVDIPMVISSR